MSKPHFRPLLSLQKSIVELVRDSISTEKMSKLIYLIEQVDCSAREDMCSLISEQPQTKESEL